MTESSDDWTPVSGLGAIAAPETGTALIVVGIDGCAPCDVVKEQVRAFLSTNAGTAASYYKLTTQGQLGTDRQLLGEEVRFYPTVVGIAGGEVAFRIKGARRDASPSDVTLFEKEFQRHAARRA